MITDTAWPASDTISAETPFKLIDDAARHLLPMLAHTYLLEDPQAPGCGLVVGHLIGVSGESLIVPLGVISRDMTPYLNFGRLENDRSSVRR
jgi:hypothetical protein